MPNKQQYINPNYHRDYNQKCRLEVLALYGSKCCRCGFTDIRALQLDHKECFVTKNRTYADSGIALYRAILNGTKNKRDFQCLCANCNIIKKHEEKEFGHKTLFVQTTDKFKRKKVILTEAKFISLITKAIEGPAK
jgi:hypothetical protein